MTIFGPDLSHFQGAVDFPAVAHSESFVTVKASQGTHSPDDHWATNRAGSLHFAVRGAYHFADFNQDAVAQARFFAGVVGRPVAGDLLWLDCEDTRAPKGSPAVNWISAFFTELARLTAMPASRLGIYTGRWWWDPWTGGSSAFANHPLWVSGYNAVGAPVTAPKADIPGGFPGAVLWQYTDAAHIPGVSGHVDRSVYAGTLAQLRARAGNPVPAPIVHYPGHPLGLGSHGPAVAELRMHLRLPAGQVYDRVVVSKVKAVQARHPQTWNRRAPRIDGVTGPVTWKVITGHA